MGCVGNRIEVFLPGTNSDGSRLVRASNLFEAKNIPLFVSVLFKESLPDKLHRIMSTQLMADLNHDLMKIQRRVSEETNHLHRSIQFARMQPTLAVATLLW